MMQITVEKTQDIYTWGARYTDGTCIAEYDREEGRGFVEVDQNRVKKLLLLHLAGGPSHSIHIPQGATPVFFRRRSVTISPLQGDAQPRPTTHCIGWKRGGEATYLFIHEDGSTLLSTDLQAV